MKQWYVCSNLECNFQSEKYPKEVKIRDMEKEIGTRCPECGKQLVYNAE